MEDLLETLGDDPPLPVLAYIAGYEIELGGDAAAPLRRALLLLATGGDPTREPELDDRAVTSLAAELDSPERRAELAAGIARLRAAAAGLPPVAAAVDRLAADGELAWRAYAAAVLADSLSED